jgi:hypothetical protein
MATPLSDMTQFFISQPNITQIYLASLTTLSVHGGNVILCLQQA